MVCFVVISVDDSIYLYLFIVWSKMINVVIFTTFAMFVFSQSLNPMICFTLILAVPPLIFSDRKSVRLKHIVWDMIEIFYLLDDVSHLVKKWSYINMLVINNNIIICVIVSINRFAINPTTVRSL